MNVDSRQFKMKPQASERTALGTTAVVTTLNNLKAQAKATGVEVKIASLLTLCGIKYWECSSGPMEV